jgi:hypothetical protein
MDAPAAGNAVSDASPDLSDEEVEALHQRFLAEHSPVTMVEGDVFFVGWTSPWAWWEADPADEDPDDVNA